MEISLGRGSGEDSRGFSCIRHGFLLEDKLKGKYAAAASISSSVGFLFLRQTKRIAISLNEFSADNKMHAQPFGSELPRANMLEPVRLHCTRSCCRKTCWSQSGDAL